MCELLAVSSHHPASINVCLEELARHGGLTAPHADGWGIAYYDGDGAVRLYREPEPASESEWVSFIEERGLRSTAIVSHIRRATQGERSLKNTQPFRRELGGRCHVFAHNGDLPNVEEILTLDSGSHRPIGETDSEYAFCALLARLEGLWRASTEPPDLESRFDVVARFAEEIGRIGMANFAYADGDAIFVHGNERKEENEAPRPPGLHVLERGSAVGGRDFRTQGLTVSPLGDPPQMSLLASVPLTGEDWRPLARGEVLALRKGRIARRHRPA